MLDISIVSALQTNKSYVKYHITHTAEVFNDGDSCSPAWREHNSQNETTAVQHAYDAKIHPCVSTVKSSHVLCVLVIRSD